MINIYDIFMSPIERFILKDIRRNLISKAKGDVLEIGVGTGVNLKYYDFCRVTNLTCLDINYSANLKTQYPKINFIKGSVEEIPYEAQKFDYVVSTLLLCSVDIKKSVSEIKRVLKQGGTFIFIEHVKPTGKFASKLVSSLNPFWKKVAWGCNINRQTDMILKRSGFGKIEMGSRGVFRYGAAEIDNKR